MPQDTNSSSGSRRARRTGGSSRSTASSSRRNNQNDDGDDNQSVRSNAKSPKNRRNVMDDDDFSVAPSMEQDVKSVVSVSFDDVYARGRKLGLGAFAVVFIGKHRPTAFEYAVKQIDRSTMFWGDRDALKDEIANLKMAREGPNIVQLHEIYEERAFCYLVMELMEGGELLEYIVEKKTFSEREARDCCRCVLSALKYMHGKKVAHRDIKPENLLLSEQNNLTSIKLADFSFAKHVGVQNGCRTLCGTPGYLAPEMLEEFPAYGVKCDVWSVGCLLFLLLGGYLPFDDDDDDVVFDQTRQGQFSFPQEFWQGVSKGSKDLITRMLTNNPKRRISAGSALGSDWVQNGDQVLEDRQVNWNKLKLIIEGRNKMKKAVQTLISANRVKDLNNGFKEYLEKRKDESATKKIKGKKDKERFVEDSLTGKPFDEFYEIGAELGEGGYAFVYQCTHKRTNKSYAVKEVILSRLENGGESTLKDEIAALKMLRGGPHIVRLFDVFEEEDHCFMVMEEMKGGDLLSRIVDKEVYTEREARGVCKILFQAIDYCHKKKIAHRDIKPENLLLVHADDDMSIKIADFGFAKKVTGNNSLSTLCGTAQYVAPEVLDCQVDGYDEMCDLWSVGVVTYILLGGYAPFEGPPDELAQFIIRGDYEFHDRYWSEISQAAKDMISGMLQVDPSCRLSAEEALHCEWMALDAEALAATDLRGTRDQMRESLPSVEVKAVKNAIIATNKFLSLAAMAGGQNQENRLNGASEEPEFDFEDTYDWGKQIGIGTFSVIHRCKKRDTPDAFAVKRVPRNDMWEEDALALQDEISCLRLTCDCEFVVKLHEVFDEPDFTFMVLEELSGGYLIDKIIEKTNYDEDEGREVVFRLISGVAYCHEQRVAIRDLKPENILLMSGENDVDVKISDFGHAKKVHNPNTLTTVCGTEGFVAPEIIEHSPEYDVECDIWSLGVVIYIILGGYRPFRGEGDVCLERVRYGKYKFHQQYWGMVSAEAKDLIRSMLVVDPARRVKAAEALQAPWITMSESEEEYQPPPPRRQGRR